MKDKSSTTILACIDGSAYLESVCKHAQWASLTCDMAVRLLHVQSSEYESVADLSGTLEIDTRTTLLEQLAQLDEARGKFEREKGKLVLEHAKRYFTDSVMPVSTLHRWGSLVDTVAELETTTQMIVIGKRGEQAQHAVRHLGSNLERVVRAVHVPVLVAAPAFVPIRRLVIAFDGGLSAHKALDFVINHSHLHDCEVHLVLVNADDSQRQSTMVAIQRLNAVSVVAYMHDMTGRADEVIATFVQTHDAQLLLMGAYSHSPVRSLFIGSTTTAILTHCPASILLFR